MRVAIIGSGISGLVVAHHLHRQHDITLFEANEYIGGHTNTLDIESAGERHAIDTGFIVFNDRTYPNFIALLDELGVRSQPTSMSFSVNDPRSGFEYNGTSLNGLFAQRTNLFKPSFYRMLRDIVRFGREAPRLLVDDADDELTVGRFLTERQYSTQFAARYLLPMGAAIWSCPPETFAQFPMRFIAEFYQNHGLLSLRNRPTWRVIVGGSRTYVERLTRPFRDRIHLNAPVERITRSDDRVILHVAERVAESFDEVIFACHSDQALNILGTAATPAERELLGAFPYSSNLALLHTDESVFPVRKRAWASWNYRLHADQSRPATVTYNMNILQHLQSDQTFCVTLNSADEIDPSRVLRRINYHHPIYTTKRAAVQRRHREVIRQHRTSFCGAYWGNGFHEDGVNSALAVCREFEPSPIVLPQTVEFAR